MNRRRDVGPGAWHAAQVMQALLWGGAVLLTGIAGAVMVARVLLWGAA